MAPGLMSGPSIAWLSALTIIFVLFGRASEATVAEVNAEQEASVDDSFDAFVAQHGRNYVPGSSEYHERKSVFIRRHGMAKQHNAKSGEIWTAGVNLFSDRTDEELRPLLGWRHFGGHSRREAQDVGDALSTPLIEMRTRDPYPETVDWRNLSMAHNVYNQGHCGSCWAVATVTVMEAHYEIKHGSVRSFSAQELVSCIPNPRHCGGKGGCDGATVELGLDWAMQSGLDTNEETPYRASDLACKKKVNVVQDMGSLDADGRIMTSPEWQAKQAAKLRKLDAEGSKGGAVSDGRSFGLTGFETLAINKEEPLVRAIVDHGPVAIAVAASAWFPYSGGVFDNCGKNWVVNHAVSLFGYGTAETLRGQRKYWLIRNSWGGQWGEKGFIRMVRRDDEENHCGTDDKPEEGVACDGAPKKVQVCGTCGVLYDSVVPFFNAAAFSKASSTTAQPPQAGQDAGRSSDSEASGDGDSTGAGDDSSKEDKPTHITHDSEFPLLVEEGTQADLAHSGSGTTVHGSVVVDSDASVVDVQQPLHKRKGRPIMRSVQP